MEEKTYDARADAHRLDADMLASGGFGSGWCCADEGEGQGEGQGESGVEEVHIDCVALRFFVVSWSFWSFGVERMIEKGESKIEESCSVLRIESLA